MDPVVRWCSQALRQSPRPRHLRKRTRSQGPSLHRNYPVSSVICPCPTPARTARQLPDQSTTLWVDSSSTSDSRLRGARPPEDIHAKVLAGTCTMPREDQNQNRVGIIRPCRDDDRDAMLAIINDAAEAYR